VGGHLRSEEKRGETGGKKGEESERVETHAGSCWTLGNIKKYARNVKRQQKRRRPQKARPRGKEKRCITREKNAMRQHDGGGVSSIEEKGEMKSPRIGEKQQDGEGEDARPLKLAKVKKVKAAVKGA